VDGMNDLQFANNNTANIVDPIGLTDSRPAETNTITRTNNLSEEFNTYSDISDYAGFIIKNDAFWLGKNGKFYLNNFNGNGFTGGKLKFAKKTSKLFDYISIPLTGLEVYDNYIKCQKGEITYEEMYQVNLAIGRNLVLSYLLPEIFFPFKLGYSIGTFIINYDDFISGLPGTPDGFDFDAHPHPAKFY
jgi:hypothetical protein